MSTAAPTRAKVADAYDRTIEIIHEMRLILTALASSGLDKTPMVQHLNRAYLELLKARMQGGAFLDIS